MKKAEKNDKRTTDRHKPGSRMLRVRKPLADALELLAGEDASDFTETGNRAIREFLKSLGRWPQKHE